LKRVTKLRLEHADNLEQAKTEAAKVKDNASKGQGTFGALGPTFKAYREHYKAAVHKAAKTMANEDHFLRQWEKFLGEDCRITRITPQNILAYRSGLLNRKLRPCTKRTVNLHTRALKQLLLLARTEGHLTKLPMEGIKQLPEKHGERPLLKADQIIAMGTEALLSHERTGAQFAEYLSFLMYSGARCTEALKLTWKQIDFTNEQVVFSGDISKGETRHTDFNRNLKNLLLTMKQNAGESEYLFPSFRTDVPVTSFKKIMVQIREKLGMEDFTFHLTRHFFISHCVMSGIDFLTIAKWVGHKDGGVLIGKIYGHLNAAHLKAQASKLVI
jgi:integrase